MVNIESYIDKLLSVNDMTKSSLTRCLSENDLEEVIIKCRDVLISQPSLIQLEAPINICGDIHGQFIDLLRVFNRCEYPPHTNYLFLGDYVDRGRQQLETICLLMGYKIRYPETFFILRGNHECHSINKVYGFYEECKRRYSVRIWECFQTMFNCLPFCALVSGRIFCMHGGLSPNLKSWNQLNNIKRPLDPPNKSIPMDLLWSDPEGNFSGWGPNSRGVSYIFGEDVVTQFCDSMDVDLIARGHQVVQDGYEFFANRKLVTVFTAPKYCGEFDNNSAVMLVQANLECSFEFIKPTNNVIRVRAKRKRKRVSKTDGEGGEDMKGC